MYDVFSVQSEVLTTTTSDLDNVCVDGVWRTTTSSFSGGNASTSVEVVVIPSRQTEESFTSSTSPIVTIDMWLESKCESESLLLLSSVFSKMLWFEETVTSGVTGEGVLTNVFFDLKKYCLK